MLKKILAIATIGFSIFSSNAMAETSNFEVVKQQLSYAGNKFSGFLSDTSKNLNFAYQETLAPTVNKVYDTAKANLNETGKQINKDLDNKIVSKIQPANNSKQNKKTEKTEKTLLQTYQETSFYKVSSKTIDTFNKEVKKEYKGSQLQKTVDKTSKTIADGYKESGIKKGVEETTHKSKELSHAFLKHF